MLRHIVTPSASIWHSFSLRVHEEPKKTSWLPPTPSALQAKILGHVRAKPSFVHGQRASLSAKLGSREGIQFKHVAQTKGNRMKKQILKTAISIAALAVGLTAYAQPTLRITDGVTTETIPGTGGSVSYVNPSF